MSFAVSSVSLIARSCLCDVPFAVSIDNNATVVVVPIGETLFPAASTYAAVQLLRHCFEEINE